MINPLFLCVYSKNTKILNLLTKLGNELYSDTFVSLQFIKCTIENKNLEIFRESLYFSDLEKDDILSIFSNLINCIVDHGDKIFIEMIKYINDNYYDEEMDYSPLCKYISDKISKSRYSISPIIINFLIYLIENCISNIDHIAYRNNIILRRLIEYKRYDIVEICIDKVNFNIMTQKEYTKLLSSAIDYKYSLDNKILIKLLCSDDPALYHLNSKIKNSTLDNEDKYIIYNIIKEHKNIIKI